MAVMIVGNSVPRAGIEPILLAFQASVLPITPPRLSDVSTLSTPTCLCGTMPQRSVQTTTYISGYAHIIILLM